MGPFPGAPWWLGVRGADQGHPSGSGSDLEGLQDHPACTSAGTTRRHAAPGPDAGCRPEAQWEYASRGGLQGAAYPSGDALLDGGQWRCNTWQGEFPVRNTLDDGFFTTAPVRTFSQNSFGLCQTVGNVWEWCDDWFDPETYAAGRANDPPGPTAGPGRVMRGGSSLCHDSYCSRHRHSARTSDTPDFSMGNTGFRTVGH